MINSVNRRSFLQAAGLAAVTGGTARPAGPKIRTAVFGTRHSHTEGKLRAMLDSSDYEVVAVHEPDPALRSQRERDPLYKGLRWVTQDALLADSSIQLVVVECQPWEAVPWGRLVIQAGKHLHLEKPAGYNWEPFRELVEEAKRRNLLLQMGWMLRGHDGINAAIHAAKQGWLGDVYLCRATINSDRDMPQRAHEAKHPGGSMFELGGHVIDRVVEVFGAPKQIRSWLRHDTSIDDQLADNTLAVFEYTKALAVVSTAARMYGAGDHRSFELIGSDGSFFIQPLDGRSKMTVSLRDARGPYKKGWQQIELPDQKRYIPDFVEMARALKSKTPLKLSYDHELAVHKALLQASGESV